MIRAPMCLLLVRVISSMEGHDSIQSLPTVREYIISTEYRIGEMQLQRSSLHRWAIIVQIKPGAVWRSPSCPRWSGDHLIIKFFYPVDPMVSRSIHARFSPAFIDKLHIIIGTEERNFVLCNTNAPSLLYLFHVRNMFLLE